MSLDKSTVHRICSGQVIMSLADAVKELVENSLNAGAKSIEIRLKQYGSESIDVIDDGSGIKENDFQNITLKQKALNSLCALANLKITTLHASSKVAYLLQYDRNGFLTKRTQCARSPGTTVTLERLFHALPVRHKELTDFLMVEYAKLMSVIKCYLLISEDIKLSCWNSIEGEDNATKMMSAHSKNSLLENIIEIFGLAAMEGLVKFEQSEPLHDHLVEFKVNEENNENSIIKKKKTDCYSSMFTIDGYISKFSNNPGPSTLNRQYLYVNKRPCDHVKLTKLINEQFCQFNCNQYPMFVLNVTINTENFEVNVTPDKLQMFIRYEPILMAIIKSSLFNMYSQLYKTVRVPLSSTAIMNSSDGGIKRPITGMNREQTESLLKQMASKKNISSKIVASEHIFSIKQQSSTKEVAEKPAVAVVTKPTPSQVPKKRSRPDHDVETRISPNRNKNQTSKQLKQQRKVAKSDSPSQSINELLNRFQNKSPKLLVPKSIKLRKTTDKMNPLSASSLFQNQIRSPGIKRATPRPSSSISSFNSSFSDRMGLHMSNRATPVFDSPEIRSKNEGRKIDKNKQTAPKGVEKSEGKENKEENSISTKDESQKRKSKTISIDWNELKGAYNQKCGCKGYEEGLCDEANLIKSLKFKTSNKEGKETELQRSLTKADFARMNIIGQFKMGYIITELDDSLFIIDQHASDELYNFEKLMSKGHLEKQLLLEPSFLNLPVSAEFLLIDNLPVLEKLGYKVQVCSNLKCGNRILIIAVPMSEQSNRELDKEDIKELLFVFSDSGSEDSDDLETISRKLYALKACRKSVMIGNSLTIEEMKRIVTHLSEIEKPWNCPHGRPTIRHIADLEFLKK